MHTHSYKEAFDRDGYVVVRQVLSPESLAALQEASQDLLEQSRDLAEDTETFLLETDHTPQRPRLRRINHPVACRPVFWQVATSYAVLDVVEELIGHDIRFHHSKLNMKVGKGGTEIGWHQDFAFFPHTNFDLVACGIALDKATRDNGCLLVIPGSHRLGIYSHRDTEGEFVGRITDTSAQFDPDQAVAVELSAGDMSIHHACIVHGSLTNVSQVQRRLFISQFAACDAVALDKRQPANEYTNRVVRGSDPMQARLAGPVTLPLRGPIGEAKSLFDRQRAAGM